MKKISYSKYKIGINYNKENKLFKVQSRYQLQWRKWVIQSRKEVCVPNFTQVKLFTLHWVVLDGKSSQKYPVNAGVPQCSILRPTLFLLCINDFPDDAICDVTIYADDIYYSPL